MIGAPLLLLAGLAAGPPPPAGGPRLDAAALRATLEQVLGRGPLFLARTGICVQSLETGETLFARDADALLNPASNVKLFTTAAALQRLGPEFRFETEVWAVGVPASGAVQSLSVRGKGDPSMTTERLWALAGEIQHRGVRVVKGDLRIDESYFDAEREAPGYDQERGDRAYLAPAGAASLNFNTVAIHVGPGARAGDRGRVEVEPASDFLEVVNRTVTVKATGRRRVTPRTQLAGPQEQVVVEGRLPLGSREQVLWRKIDEPALYFGHTLKRLLELRGVKVLGKVRRAAVPPEARLLHLAESEALGEIVRKLNKTSNNYMAEQLVKVMGAEARGGPGTWPKGIAAGEEALAELGLPRGSYVWMNGSGLNDTNRFSARQTATLLREAWRRFPLMAEFVGSLPVAGRDGTIRWRMEGSPAEGRLRAKTGTLEGVTGLSGYVETGSGERLAFAILVNDFAGRAQPVVRAIDALGAALAEAGRPAPAPAAGGEDALANLRARVSTYYGMGLSGDRRNAAFLRTALRSERDPVVRMAAAEAAYLVDPDSDTARRAFLDAVATDAESLARLRGLAGDLDRAAPVVGSLADLAIEGDAEAVARFLELAPAAMADAGLAGAYAEALDEVARNAPLEVAAGLRGAPPPAGEAALRALARGVGKDEAAHPVAAALQAAADDTDPARAGPARDLLQRLAERTAELREAPRATAPETAAPALPTPAPEAQPGGG